MKDAYDNLFKYYNKEEFFRNSLEEIIYISEEEVRKNWIETIDKLTSNKEIYIRGYGRDGAGTQAFITLYKYLFRNENVKKDQTNNAKPTRIIANLTGLSKIIKKEVNGFERIQNYQISHLFGRTKNPLLFTSAWNIAYIPKYIDPFTGHETQGQHKTEFQKLFDEKNRLKFNDYLKEYNLFVTDKVQPYFKDSLQLTKQELKMNKSDFNDFKNSAIAELSII